MYRILIVEDEKIMRNELATMLKNNGYETCCIEEFENVAEQVSKENADLILLDINLPCENGYQICSKIRADMSVPIIFLTSRNSDMDELNSFISGGDDYITKPFQPLEVVARVKAQLRRYKRYNMGTVKAEEILEHKGLILNKKTHECFLNERLLSLTPTEFSILAILCEQKGNVVSAEELFHQIWKDEYYSKSNNTITVHIRHLREKMEDSFENPKYIKTVWGCGYKIEK